MTKLRQRLTIGVDRALAALIVLILVGTPLAFGGAVWWARIALGVATLLLVLTALVRAALAGRLRLLRSPLGLIGLMAMGLALMQLIPLPASLARRVAEGSQAVHGSALGFEPARSPVTLDRSATLRWLAGASACWALFCVVAHFTDRLRHLRLVWGSIVLAFGLCTIFGAVQLLGNGSGLYGWLVPGQAPFWAPSLAEAAEAPGWNQLRAPDGSDQESPWAFARPSPSFAIGSLMGGPGAYLALAALGLPLAMGLTLQSLAPQGSRESLAIRLVEEGGLARLILLVLVLAIGSTLVGYLGGPWLGLPIAIGLLLAGLLPVRGVGVGVPACLLTTVCLLAMAGGVGLGTLFERPMGTDPMAEAGRWQEVRAVWGASVRIAGEYPLLGSGLGSFAVVYPQYKSQDASSTTALSSLLQWWAETGVVGLGLLAAGLVWCLWRLPRAWRRVGSADRALSAALLGAVVGFGLFATVHWSVELIAIALAACAVGGTWNRWLAGGTDLFVESDLRAL